ncbi:MAG: magnesium transporter [Bacteroidia bacterium]|nr:magnesium transporter [Bacteroidia bacterium]MDW8088427.1 magnesium transporter [Bacteroidia bacterium]
MRTIAELNALKTELAKMSVEEVVTLLNQLAPTERVLTFRLLEKNKALEVFEAMDSYEQTQLVQAMDDPQLLELLRQIDPESQARLLGELPAMVISRLLQELPEEARERVSLVLGFPEGSAGRLMDPAYLALPSTSTVKDTLLAVRNSTLEPEDLEVVFTLGPGRLYEGYVRLPRLIKAPLNQPIIQLAEEEAIWVSAYASEEEVVERFLERRLNLLPVVDREGRLLGVIHANRILPLMQAREAGRMVRFGGAAINLTGGADIDMIEDPLPRLYLGRVVWLVILTIFGVFTSAFVAAQEQILEAAIVLAAFIAPIIDMGGNTGSQTATLVIRAMALGQVHPRLRDFMRLVARDFPVALGLGISIGLLEAILAVFTKSVSLQILLVVGLSMLIVTVLGSLIGISLPFLAKRLGADPAVLSAPFITSIMDFLGVLVYFGLAYLFLRNLLPS